MTRARTMVIPLALGTIALALLATYATPHLVALTRGGDALEEQSVQERRMQVRQWWNTMNGSDWLVGHGIAGYVPTIAQAFPQQKSWEYQPVHNVPLLVCGEIGLLGLLIVLTWSSTIDHLNFSRFPNSDALRAFAMGNVILVILFFDHYLWTLWPGLALVAFVMAMTVRMGEDSP